MRTYGRIVPDILFPNRKKWIVVTTDVNGYNDMVWLTTLIQTIKLNLGESPFFSNFGIPAHSSVVSQLAPDYYMSYIQQKFASHFLYLSLVNQPNAIDDNGIPSPGYTYTVITKYGAYLSEKVPY